MAKPDDPTAAAPSTAAAGEGLAVGRQTPLEPDGLEGPSPFPSIAEYAFLSDCETNALVAPSGNVEWLCSARPGSRCRPGGATCRGRWSLRRPGGPGAAGSWSGTPCASAPGTTSSAGPGPTGGPRPTSRPSTSCSAR